MKKIFVFVMLSSFFFACSSSGVQKQEEIIRPVRYQEISRSGATSVKTFSGAAVSGQETELSMKVAGNLRQVSVKTGEKVRKGRLIAVLDDTDYRIQYDQAAVQKKGAEQQHKGAEVALATAKSTYERMERLYVVNSVSQSDYERAKMQYETAQTQLETAETQVRAADNAIQAAQNQLNYTRLYAPFDGVINEVKVKENENISAGRPIAVISKPGEPKVSVGVAENFINQIREGMEVEVRFSIIAGKTFAGVVEEISYASDRSSTFPIKINLNKPDEEIRPGMAAEVRFVVQPKQEEQSAAIIVPAVSVGEDRQGRFVYVIQSEEANLGTIERIPVEIGGLTSKGIEVLAGLKGGEKVVTAGVSAIQPRMKVKLLN